MTAKLPTSQKLWLRCFDSSGNLKYAITSNADRSKYFRYDYVNGEYIKTATAANPKELE